MLCTRIHSQTPVHTSSNAACQLKNKSHTGSVMTRYNTHPTDNTLQRTTQHTSHTTHHQQTPHNALFTTHSIVHTYLVHGVVPVGQEDPVQVGRVGDHQQQDALLQHQHVPAAALVVALAPHEQRADHLLRWVIV